jgi:hypothetical protein
MSDRPKPDHGEQYGPCAVCGKTAMPMYGEFLCADHGTYEHAQRVKED